MKLAAGHASGRIAAYLHLAEHATEDGEWTLTARQLGARVGVHESVVRRDLRALGIAVGIRHVGYPLDDLAGAIRQRLARASGGSGGTILVAALVADGGIATDPRLAEAARLVRAVDADLLERVHA